MRLLWWRQHWARNGVRDYWANATRNQADVIFSHEIICISGNRGLARWWASFKRVPTGMTARLDGIFLLEFDNEGLRRELREWWHRPGAEPEVV